MEVILLNRQQRRFAEQRAEKNRFPFPEHQEWLRNFLRENPACYAQVRDGKIVTNLSGENEELTVAEFGELLESTKAGFEKEKGS